MSDGVVLALEKPRPAGARDQLHGRAALHPRPRFDRSQLVLPGPPLTPGTDADAAAFLARMADDLRDRQRNDAAVPGYPQLLVARRDGAADVGRRVLAAAAAAGVGEQRLHQRPDGIDLGRGYADQAWNRRHGVNHYPMSA